MIPITGIRLLKMQVLPHRAIRIPSHSVPAESHASSVWTEPDVFTPDNDGNDDFLAIFYHLDDPGSLANVMIFDSRGKLVRRLANNDMAWYGRLFNMGWDQCRRQP